MNTLERMLVGGTLILAGAAMAVPFVMYSRPQNGPDVVIVDSNNSEPKNTYSDDPATQQARNPQVVEMHTDISDTLQPNEEESRLEGESLSEEQPSVGITPPFDIEKAIGELDFEYKQIWQKLRDQDTSMGDSEDIHKLYDHILGQDERLADALISDIIQYAEQDNGEGGSDHHLVWMYDKVTDKHQQQLFSAAKNMADKILSDGYPNAYQRASRMHMFLHGKGWPGLGYRSPLADKLDENQEGRPLSRRQLIGRRTITFYQSLMADAERKKLSSIQEYQEEIVKLESDPDMNLMRKANKIQFYRMLIEQQENSDRAAYWDDAIREINQQLSE